MYLPRFTKAISLTFCGGLTLAGCQVPTKPLHHFPPQHDGGGVRGHGGYGTKMEKTHGSR